MKIALTGGNGQVGREIARQALAAGYEVVSLDRVVPDDFEEQENLTILKADMADYDKLVAAFSGCDAMIHMAAITNPNHAPDQIVHNNNVVGSYNAMRAAVENDIMRICQASSVNAVGISFSREPRHDYFPVDELHPTYNEDPYSLSKWICEQQADSFARRYENIHIASMRFPFVFSGQGASDRPVRRKNQNPATHLWSYTLTSSAARACLLSLDAPFSGHEVFYITSPDTSADEPTLELAARYFPEVPVKGDLSGHRSFITSAKAKHMLGWKH